MTPEGRVKKEVKGILGELIEDHGNESLWFYMPVQSGYGQKGIPDFVLCVIGYFVGIETKANGKSPTDLQSLTLDAITVAKGIALVIDETNIGKLKETLNDVICGRRSRVLPLSWRRQPIPASKDDYTARPRRQAENARLERSRDWQDILGSLGE